MKVKARILKRSTFNAQRSTLNVQPGCGITPNEQARWIDTFGLDGKPLGEAPRLFWRRPRTRLGVILLCDKTAVPEAETCEIKVFNLNPTHAAVASKVQSPNGERLSTFRQKENSVAS